MPVLYFEPCRLDYCRLNTQRNYCGVPCACGGFRIGVRAEVERVGRVDFKPEGFRIEGSGWKVSFLDLLGAAGLKGIGVISID